MDFSIPVLSAALSDLSQGTCPFTNKDPLITKWLSSWLIATSLLGVSLIHWMEWILEFYLYLISVGTQKYKASSDAIPKAFQVCDRSDL